MPARKLHDKFTELVLGASFSSISGMMDEPYSRFRQKHRSLRHDSAFLLEALRRFGLRPALAAWLHLVLDYDHDLARTMEEYESLRVISGKSGRRGLGRRACEG